jgi:hypothetical protein
MMYQPACLIAELPACLSAKEKKVDTRVDCLLIFATRIIMYDSDRRGTEKAICKTAQNIRR